jgi:hypothetical protein
MSGNFGLEDDDHSTVFVFCATLFSAADMAGQGDLRLAVVARSTLKTTRCAVEAHVRPNRCSLSLEMARSESLRRCSESGSYQRGLLRAQHANGMRVPDPVLAC